MDEILQKQFVAWCLQEILKHAWEGDKGTALAIIHGRANVALAILLGSDEDREEVWKGFLPEYKTQIEFTSLEWDDYVLESLNRVREKRQLKSNG
jgi:hypothetical protein